MYRTANLYLPLAQFRGLAAYRETNTSLVFRLGRLCTLEGFGGGKAPRPGRRGRRPGLPQAETQERDVVVVLVDGGHDLVNRFSQAEDVRGWGVASTPV